MGQNTFPSASVRSMFAATTSFLSAFTLSSRICMLVSAGLLCANAGTAVSAATHRTAILVNFIDLSPLLLAFFRKSRGCGIVTRQEPPTVLSLLTVQAAYHLAVDRCQN